MVVCDRCFLKPSTVIDVMARNGDVLTNGLLGEEKKRRTKDARTDMAIEVLRTRMHLIPSNALQDPLWEDVQTLPFGGWVSGGGGRGGGQMTGLQ